jgi:hypothetical protein
LAFTTIPSAGARIYASTLSSLITELRPVTARKTVDETVNNSATLQNDDELFVAVEASLTYDFEAEIFYNSGTTPDFKFGWTFPAGLTMTYSVYAAGGAVFLGYSEIQTSVPVIDGQGAAVAALLKGTVIVFSTAGTLQLQWAQNTANASNTVVAAGSYIRLRRI